MMRIKETMRTGSGEGTLPLKPRAKDTVKGDTAECLCRKISALQGGRSILTIEKLWTSDVASFVNEHEALVFCKMADSNGEPHLYYVGRRLVVRQLEPVNRGAVNKPLVEVLHSWRWT